jgi:hypothetical protein
MKNAVQLGCRQLLCTLLDYPLKSARNCKRSNECQLVDMIALYVLSSTL